MKRYGIAPGLCGLALLMAMDVAAQTAPKPTVQPPAAAPAATTPAPAAATPAPDRTTASFGDWVLRCDRRTDVTPPQRFCELALTIQRPGDPGPQAQIAVGRIVAGEPVRLTVLLPINVTFQPSPRLVTEGREALSIDIGWLRCLPSGCFANAPLSDEAVRKLRAQKDAGRLDYRDGPGRDVSLPISFRGFSEAWEAFVRESAN